jgi:hypothetical protein
VQTDTTTIVQIDADGDGTVESKIVLTGLIDLTADDFIL